MSAISSSFTRFRQALNRSVSSYPFLSGDTFKDLADFSFGNMSDFSASRPWKDVDVVFCKSELLDFFQSEKPATLNPKVLICGNSDYDFHDFEFQNLRSLRALFLQNSFISDNKFIYTLPIGLENAKYASNGRVKLYSKKLDTAKECKVLVGPFGNTHLERIDLLSLPTDPFLHRVTERVSTRKHLKNLDQFMYVSCPRGNGVDTHRVWEAMYRGAIPILRRNTWSTSLSDFGYPVILLDDWNDLIGKSLLNSKLSPNNVRTFPFLWMDSWSKLISSFL